MAIQTHGHCAGFIVQNSYTSVLPKVQPIEWTGSDPGQCQWLMPVPSARRGCSPTGCNYKEWSKLKPVTVTKASADAKCQREHTSQCKEFCKEWSKLKPVTVTMASADAESQREHTSQCKEIFGARSNR